jgi:nitrogen-specific signal transduction histidine kinase
LNNSLTKKQDFDYINEYKGYALLDERLEITFHTSMVADLLKITASPHNIKLQNPYFYSFLKKLITYAENNVDGCYQEELLLNNHTCSCTVNIEKNAEHGQQKHHVFLSYLLDSKSQKSFFESPKNNTKIDDWPRSSENNKLTLEPASSPHKLKLAAIGEMSASIGHEINNPLAIAIGNLGFLKNSLLDETRTSNKSNHYLHAIENSLERVKAIVSGLSYLSRNESHESKSDVLIIDLLEITVLLLRETYAKQGVTLYYSPNQTQKNCVVNGHLGELQQVLMNIIDNARDAVIHASRKEIHISTELIHNQVIIKVTDSGMGILPDEQKKIFDNFYTTKKGYLGTGLGTGLGLGIVKRIVEDHEGTISVDSTVGKGASFLITLPITDSSVHPSIENLGVDFSIEQHSSPPDLNNLNAIAITEEPMVLEVVAGYLESFGMNVISTSNISEVLDEIKKGNHQLLITDMCMPNCDGLQLIEQVKNLATSNIKCILMTGGTRYDHSSNPSSYAKFDGCLEKPFGISELSDLLNSLDLKSEEQNVN